MNKKLFGIAGLLISLQLFSQPGSLLPGFGQSGIVVSTYQSSFTKIAVQPSGKLIVLNDVVGEAYDEILRYNVNGTIDNTFGTSGRFFLFYQDAEGDFHPAHASDMLTQTDGKIVLVSGNKVFRYTVNGLPDPAFGDGGVTSIELTGISFSFTGMTIDNIGRIVVVGAASFSGTQNLTMARLTGTGTLDTDFNGGGIRIVTLGDGIKYTGTDVTTDAGNNLIIGVQKGDQFVSIHEGFITKYTNAGSLDLSFGSQGKLITTYPPHSLHVNIHGLVVFTTLDIQTMTVNGTNLNSIFHGSTSGTQIPFIGLSDVGFQPDGKIIATGIIEFVLNDYSRAWVRRFNEDGTLDYTFGTQGQVITDLFFRTIPFSLAYFNKRIFIAGKIMIQLQNLFQDFGLINGYDASDISVTCPNVSVSYRADQGQCYATINNIDPVILPNTATPTVNYSIEYNNSVIETGTGSVSGKHFQKGETRVTYSYTDITTQSCSFNITVQDREAPVMNCPSSLAVPMQQGQCYAIVTLAQLGAGTATDNCPGATVANPVMPAGNIFIKGATTLIWTATDGNGNTGTCAQIVTVTDNERPTITGESASTYILSPSNHTMRNVTIDYTATDNCAVTSVITVTSNEPINGAADGDTDPDWIVIDHHHVQLRAERSAVGDGRIYTITITATDPAGNTAVKTVEVRVPHNIKNPHSGQPFKVGSTVTFEGEFWDKAGNNHSAKWLIDENTTVNATVTEPSGNKNGKVTGSYKFTAPGVYKLQMNVTDQKGITNYANTAGDLEAIIVIFDPNGGNTYGGGYYNSPAGALRSNPSVTGKASYGFAMNYFKNSTNPKGETQFEFKVGSFEFNALNFEYLVISNSMSQFKGTGKITGGQSGVAFTMTVVDGQLDGSGVDKIRMKVYNKNNGSIIYDNQPGAIDAALPTQAVGTNSTIVISGTNSSLTQSNTTQKAEIEATAPEVSADLDVIAFPNPSTNNFMINVKAKTNERITMQVVDMYGRIIETRNVIVNTFIRFGDRYIAGTYFVRVTQGKQHKEIKLIKLSD